MATFSDLVTLLLTFFILMMSMANFEDSAKVEAAIESIHRALRPGGYEPLMPGSAVQKAYTVESRRTQILQPTVARLRDSFSKHLSDDFVKMTEREQEIRLRLDERAFFRTGSASLHPAAYALMADVAVVLADADVQIRVEGYSDRTGDEETNWRLSSDRALAVVLALRDKGPVPGERMEAVGMGPQQNADGDPDWGRRVEIVLTAGDPASRSHLSNLSGEADG